MERAEYGRRVGDAMDYLSDGNRTLIWVGIPNDDNPDVTARMQVQDEVVRAEAAKRPKVVFIDTWARFSGRNGGWAEFVVDPRDGEGKDVRADDGFHLNQNGAEILAIDIAEAVKADLRDPRRHHLIPTPHSGQARCARYCGAQHARATGEHRSARLGTFAPQCVSPPVSRSL